MISLNNLLGEERNLPVKSTKYMEPKEKTIESKDSRAYSIEHFEKSEIDIDLVFGKISLHEFSKCSFIESYNVLQIHLATTMFPTGKLVVLLK